MKRGRCIHLVGSSPFRFGMGPVSLGAFLLLGMDLYGAWWPRTVLATFTFRQRFFVDRYRRIIH